MRNPAHAAQHARVVELAARSHGVCNREVQALVGVPMARAGWLLSVLAGKGLIFRGGAGVPHRWFTDPARAAAHVSVPHSAAPGLTDALATVVSAHWRESELTKRRALAARLPLPPGEIRYTRAPTCLDQRYTVHQLPPDYVSVLNAAESRPWVSAVLGRRGGAA